MAFVSGTSGRVAIGNATVAGIKTWRLDQVTAEVGLPNFESTVDGNSRVWPDYLAGLSGATGTLEGYFNSGAGDPTDSFITTGVFVTLALLFNKVDSWGFGVTALVTAFGSGTNVENQPATFTVSFRVTGAVPLSAVVV